MLSTTEHSASPAQGHSVFNRLIPSCYHPSIEAWVRTHCTVTCLIYVLAQILEQREEASTNQKAFAFTLRP